MTDLIRRADAIEAICNAQCELDVPHYPQCDQVKWCDEVKALLALPSADAEWIPCSERLPLVSGEFLVTLVDHDGTWVSTAQWNMTFGGRWQDIFPNDGYRDISNVIAWKTLPKPYTKGDNE